MAEAEWLRTEDWGQMLAAVPNIDGSRKLRLWCVAWSRVVLAVWKREPSFFGVHSGFFTPAAVVEYEREIDAGESFADGQLTRRALQAARGTSGGPYNVFRFASGLSRLTPDWLNGGLGSFTRAFQIPTAGELTALLRDIFGNPFCPVVCAPEWRTDTVLALARQMYESRDFSAMPILADAL